MVKRNVPRRKESTGVFTHEGAPAAKISPAQELRRSVMACMLWEDAFYEDGVSIAERIQTLVEKVEPEVVAALAIEARTAMKLRHVPLWVVRAMAKLPEHKAVVAKTLEAIIQRPDELTEFLALYWEDGRQPLSGQVKKGLARAFKKFDAYQLAKYNRDDIIKLRDVLFLSHAKPKDGVRGYTKGARKDGVTLPAGEGNELFARLVQGRLAPPDTWEVALSATKGEQKLQAWERLLTENRLPAMALLRNLRNLKQVGVHTELIEARLREMNTQRILPFRFVSAAKAVPSFEPVLDEVMLRCCEQIPKVPGETILVVDVSGSMYGGRLSARSGTDRAHVACALAALVREICERSDIYATAGNDSSQVHATRPVPARRGMALVDAIYQMCTPLGGGGIFLKQCLDYIWTTRDERPADRIIVITDEQDCDHTRSRSPLHARQIATKQYMVNVASYKNGIGYGPWTHIDGFSEAILDYIRSVEA